ALPICGAVPDRTTRAFPAAWPDITTRGRKDTSHHAAGLPAPNRRDTYLRTSEHESEPEDVGTRKAVLPPPHVPEPPDSRVGHRHPLRAPEHVPRNTDPATVTAPLNRRHRVRASRDSP